MKKDLGIMHGSICAEKVHLVLFDVCIDLQCPSLLSVRGFGHTYTHSLSLSVSLDRNANLLHEQRWLCNGFTTAGAKQ